MQIRHANTWLAFQPHAPFQSPEKELREPISAFCWDAIQWHTLLG